MRVVLTRNIGRRAFPGDRDGEDHQTFLRLRGTTEFAKAVRDLADKLEDNEHFKILDDWIDNRTAHKLGVLTQFVIKRETMPIYQIDKQHWIHPDIKEIPEAEKAIEALTNLPEHELIPEEREQLEKLLDKKLGPDTTTLDGAVKEILQELNKRLEDAISPDIWDNITVTFSRYGLFQIVLTRDCSEDYVQLRDIIDPTFQLEQNVSILSRLFELAKTIAGETPVSENTKLSSELDYSIQWECVRPIIREFIKSINLKIMIERDTRDSQEQNSTNQSQATVEAKQSDSDIINFLDKEKLISESTYEPSYPLRFRYVVLELHDLKYKKVRVADKPELDKKKLLEDFKVELATLLEGVSIPQSPGAKKKSNPRF